MFADSHTHITMITDDNDKQIEIIKESIKGDVQYLLHIAVNDLSELERAKQLKSQFPHNLFIAYGYHPSDIHKDNINQAMDYTQQAIPHINALGEIGLDYYHNKDKQSQQKALYDFCALAKQHNLPIIIHSRDAIEDTYNILKDVQIDKGIMHCFSADYQYAKRFIDLGFYISFAGNVTYKKAVSIQEAAKKIPMDTMLIETDAPFLTPVPHRGKRNKPLYVKHTAEFIASLRGVDIETIAFHTTHNLKDFLDIR